MMSSFFFFFFVLEKNLSLGIVTGIFICGRTSESLCFVIFLLLLLLYWAEIFYLSTLLLSLFIYVRRIREIMFGVYKV